MNIPLNIDIQQICLHLLNVAILTFGLYMLLYKPVKDFMEKREAYYRDMDDQANAKLAEAEKTRLISSNIKYESGHGGGDDGIMEDFTASLSAGIADSRSSISRSVESHLMACAIEQARLTGSVVDMNEYKKTLKEANQ